MDTIDSFSNIVTPPDLINSRVPAVLLIDPDNREIEDLALFLKTAKESFTVYVYKNELNEPDWLQTVLNKSPTLIINTVQNDLSPIKDKLATTGDAYYYGPKNFLMNKKVLKNPIDYFSQYLVDAK
jgi:hypothetical protein